MNEWKYVKIGDVCIVERGGSPRPIDKYITEREDGINWIKIGDTTDSMYITSTAQKIIPEGMKKSRYVKAGDFLLSNSMSFGRPYILKIDGCIHDGWLVLRDEKELFDKRFLYYYLSAPITYEKFKSMAVGGVVNNLNSEMVRGVTIPLPPKSEQESISDTLDYVSNLIFLRTQQLSKLDELVKARFVEMFGDSEYNTMNWPTAQLSTLCNVGSSKRFYQNELTTDGVPFLRISDLNERIDGKNNTPALFITREKYDELKTNDLVPLVGDILVTARGTLGRCYIIKENDEFYFQDGMISWLSDIDEQISSLFISHLFITTGIQKQIVNLQAGSTVAYLSIAMLKKLNIMIPPKALQDQFTTFVEQTYKSKAEIQKSLEKLETLKKALMQKYFR